MTRAAWILIVLLVLGHLAYAIAVPVLLEKIGPGPDFFTFLLVGVCVGQVNLIAIWAALAPGRLLLRVLWSVFLASLMWYALVLGNRAVFNGFEPSYFYFGRKEALHLGALLLAGVLIAQAPLWVASAKYGWRLLPPQRSDKTATDDRQFNIAHLLAVMGLVSVALGLGRFVLPEGEWDLAVEDGKFYIGMSIVAAVNLLVVVPATWGAFAPAERIGPLVMGWLVYVVVVTAVEIVIISAVVGNSPPDDVWIDFSVFNLSQCACVFGTLVGLRMIGFTLRRIDSKGPSIPTVPPGDAEL